MFPIFYPTQDNGCYITFERISILTIVYLLIHIISLMLVELSHYFLPTKNMNLFVVITSCLCSQ